MSLQFYIGGSGAGKSRKLHYDIIAEAKKHPGTNYLVIVPDQFTMQTQMDFVTEHPDGGIMNIDVLSFGRLSHRILEEVGAGRIPVLDDTGKSLILKTLSETLKEQLPSLGSNLKKIGYIHEVKSAISEFMQYGISPDDVHELIDYAKERGALSGKLADLEVLYRAFLEYTDQKYVTREEKLNLLRKGLHKSNIIKDCVVAFDGFTGFTPIQYRVIEELLVLAREVKVTIILDAAENPYRLDGEQKLFHLSKKTVSDLRRIAANVPVEELSPVIVREAEDRFVNNPELRHLEQNLFRYPVRPYPARTSRVHLMQAGSIQEEIRETCLKIRRLIRERDYCYRDIAVVAGDLSVYADDMEQMLAVYEIPAYVDYTRPVMQNPFTRFIRSALQIIAGDFSIDAVLMYLRSGMTDLKPQEADVLENYLRKCGIRGKSAWTHRFAAKGKRGENTEPLIEQVNVYRERILAQLAPLMERGDTAEAYIRNVYDFLVVNGCQEKLMELSELFAEQGDAARSKEYGQLFRFIVDLLDQMDMLLGKEKMTFEEFVQILEAGFGEIKVGTIPQEVDRVLIGDMERTRLKQVKVLFFLGVNDGNIPRNTSGGGLISDIDREFLQGSSFEFAPTPRQQMYIQRLYLYINMTKPSEELYISLASTNGAGATLHPSYLIRTLYQLFPQIDVIVPGGASLAERLESPLDAERYFAEGIRKYASGTLPPEEQNQVQTIYLWGNDDHKMKLLVETAFASYKGTPLARKIASALYGQILAGSVSRLEQYAACAYAHFLQYGLALRERQEFTFEAVDLGNVYHTVLEWFGLSLEADGYQWLDFPDEYGDRTIDRLLEQCAVEYGDTVLYSTAQMQHSLKTMGDILKRSVRTMKHQLSQGKFIPKQFEMSFQSLTDLEDLSLGLTSQEKIRLRGRVDRIDACEEEETLYIKIIDYKSGAKDFDLAAVYYGLQLQLVVYMDAVMKRQGEQYPEKEIVPAGTLYYQVYDPLIEESGELTEEQIEDAIRKKLCTKGVVSSDAHVVDLLHSNLSGSSDSIPVSVNRDGSFSAYSRVLAREEQQLVTDYVNYKIKRMGQEILLGNIDAIPSGYKNNACDYCSFKKICGFSAKDGYKHNELEEKDRQTVLEKMKEALEQER